MLRCPYVHIHHFSIHIYTFLSKSEIILNTTVLELKFSLTICFIHYSILTCTVLLCDFCVCSSSCSTFAQAISYQTFKLGEYFYIKRNPVVENFTILSFSYSAECSPLRAVSLILAKEEFAILECSFDFFDSLVPQGKHYQSSIDLPLSLSKFPEHSEDWKTHSSQLLHSKSGSICRDTKQNAPLLTVLLESFQT